MRYSMLYKYVSTICAFLVITSANAIATPLSLEELKTFDAIDKAGKVLQQKKTAIDDSASDKKIIQAVTYGDFPSAKRLINKNTYIEMRNESGYTLLCLSAVNGNTDIIKLLLSYGANPNNKCNSTDGPADKALLQNKVEAAKIIMANGGEPLYENGYAYYMKAIDAYDMELIEILSHYININIQNVSGSTPISYAFSFKPSLPLTKLFISLGANIYAGDYKYTLVYQSKYADPEFLNSEQRGILDYIRRTIKEQIDQAIIDNRSPLMKAVISNNYEEVKTLIANGANVNQNNDSETPLTLALDRATPEIQIALINAGANIFSNPSILHLAAAKSNAAVVELLLAKGIDSNIRDKDGSTPLMFATRNTVKPLLNAGADIYAINRNEAHAWMYIKDVEVAKAFISAGFDFKNSMASFKTPLISAIDSGNIDLVKLYLDNNADANQPSFKGITPLYEAIYKGQKEIVKLLLQHGASLHISPNNEETALTLWAGCSADLDMLKILLNAGAKINEANKSGSFPLNTFLASGHETTDALEFMLKAGANPNAIEKDKSCGYPALYFALKEGDLPYLKLLLQAGADPNIRGKQNSTPLMDIYDFSTAIADALLNAGADINAIDANGKSVLDHASELKSMAYYGYLKEKGADINRTYNGKTDLAKAIEKGDYEAAKRLLLKNADPLVGETTPLEIALKSNNQDFALLMVNSIKNFNTKAGLYDNSLMLILKNGSDTMLKIAVGRGVNVNEQTKGGSLPIVEAAKLGDPSKIQTLIKAGADVNKSDADGKSAIVEIIERGNLPAVSACIKSGADITSSQSAIVAAAKLSNTAILELLLESGAIITKDSPAIKTAILFQNTKALELLLNHTDKTILSGDDKKDLLMRAGAVKSKEIKELIKSMAKKYKKENKK